jgi:hypothetical protein
MDTLSITYKIYCTDFPCLSLGVSIPFQNYLKTLGNFGFLSHPLKNDSFFIKMHELLQNVITYGIVAKAFGASMLENFCYPKQKP